MSRKILILNGFAFLLRGFNLLLSRWFLLLVAALLLSPVGPHIRAEYEYRDIGNARIFLHCTYLGSRGFVTPDFRGNCPPIAIINANEWRQP